MLREGEASSAARGFAAYDRATLDRFFADAQEQRARLLADIADARRRVAQAEAAMRTADGPEHASIHALLDAQRQLREESRAYERAIAAIRADAEAEANEILREAEIRSRDPRRGQAGDPAYER